MIPAKYFDIIGLPTFIFLFILGTYLVKKDEMISMMIMTIGFIGTIVDGYSIFTNFIIKH
jgi:multisubunit Na+/H+ antiporter MnhC subunit